MLAVLTLEHRSSLQCTSGGFLATHLKGPGDGIGPPVRGH